MVSNDFFRLSNWKEQGGQHRLSVLGLVWGLGLLFTLFPEGVAGSTSVPLEATSESLEAATVTWEVASSSGDLIPPGMSCSEECPGIGTRQLPMSQQVSPIANPCADMPLTLLFERWGAKVTFPQPQCPLWVMLEPQHALPVVRSGCCLFERQPRSILQQMLQCECTDFFIICWSRECLPAGEARIWQTLDHWVSLPCVGESSTSDCAGGSR